MLMYAYSYPREIKSHILESSCLILDHDNDHAFLPCGVIQAGISLDDYDVYFDALSRQLRGAPQISPRVALIKSNITGENITSGEHSSLCTTLLL